MAHEIDLLLATPTMRPCLPVRSGMRILSRRLRGSLLRRLPAGSVAPGETRRPRALGSLPMPLGRTASVWSRGAAAHRTAATHVAVGPIAKKLLATAVLLPRTEPIGTATGLTDRELGRRPGGRWLPFGARQ